MNILVTGATGCFGHAFVRVVLDRQITDRVCIFSRDEHKQARMRAELEEDPRCRWFVGDVRDRDRLRRAMAGIDLVVHAAALKRIEVGHYNPIEMVRTNVDGAINVIEAAIDAKVCSVVGLSTDKAFQPVSAYGYSKALAESLFIAANNDRGPKFVVTRYGNVAGSTGSVIPKWREILLEGDTVPVTDPECTRFHMRIDQAVDMVLAKQMWPGLHIADLPAYRLGDLAVAMGAKAMVIGLGHWEKRHEQMAEGCTSDQARRLTVDELREELRHV